MRGRGLPGTNFPDRKFLHALSQKCAGHIWGTPLCAIFRTNGWHMVCSSVLADLHLASGRKKRRSTMSVSSIGASSSGQLSQMLEAMLAKLDATSASSATAGNSAASSTSIAASTAANSLTGSATPSLSSMILGTLIGMQMQSSGDAAQSASSSSSNPVQQLFSAIDSDGSGTISQSELENYIEKLGGTQADADTLYSALSQSGSKGITEVQLASDAPQGPPPDGGFGGPGGSPATASGSSSSLIALLSSLVQTLNANGGGSFGQSSSTSSLISQANNLMQSIESTSNGNITESAFEDFFTANGGTTSEADKDFAALDTSGTASLNSSDFTSALENLENNTGNSSPALTLLNALAQNASSGGSSPT